MSEVSSGRPKWRFATWLASLPTSAWIAAGVALVLAVSALFGGLDDADTSSKQLPVVGVDEPVVRDELTVEVHSARLSLSAPDYSFDPEEGHLYLLVEGTVTNNYSVTTRSLSDLLELPIAAEPRTSRLARSIDGSSLPQANPGLPTRIVWIFEVPEAAVAPGDTVRLTVMARSFMEDGDVTFGSYWSGPQPTAHVDVEVRG